jgi:hypothetical protein
MILLMIDYYLSREFILDERCRVKANKKIITFLLIFFYMYFSISLKSLMLISDDLCTLSAAL